MAKKSSSSGKSGAAGSSRSAKSGQFVTRDYAKKHPSTTITHGKPGGSKPGKKSK